MFILKRLRNSKINIWYLYNSISKIWNLVKKIEHFGINAVAIQKELSELKDIGVKVLILYMPYLNNFSNDDTMQLMVQNIMLIIFSYMAQMEREKTFQRVKEEISVTECAKILDIGRSAFYKYKKLWKDK